MILLGNSKTSNLTRFQSYTQIYLKTITFSSNAGNFDSKRKIGKPHRFQKPVRSLLSGFGWKII